MSKLKFQELYCDNSFQFRQVMYYCKHLFDFSNADIASLIGRMLAKGDQQAKAHVLSAEENGEMVGFVVFYYFPKTQIGFIDSIAVLPKFRRRYIGTGLYQKMTQFLREHHPEVVGHLLEVSKYEEGLETRKAFFLKQGSIPVDLSFFPLAKSIVDSGLNVMIHPYKLDCPFTNQTMADIFKELNDNLIH